MPKYTFCVGDLENAALSKIEKKDLDIAVLVPRVFRRKIPAGFKNDKPAVAADRSCKCFRPGICYLTDKRIRPGQRGRGRCGRRCLPDAGDRQQNC